MTVVWLPRHPLWGDNFKMVIAIYTVKIPLVDDKEVEDGGWVIEEVVEEEFPEEKK